MNSVNIAHVNLKYKSGKILTCKISDYLIEWERHDFKRLQQKELVMQSCRRKMHQYDQGKMLSKFISIPTK